MHTSKRTVAAICLLTMICLGAPVEASSEMDATIVLYGRILDGTGAVPIEDGVIVISNGIISAVGERTVIDVPEDANTISLPNATILPGFINAHVHKMCLPMYQKVWASQGVTTVRDVGVRYVEGWGGCLSMSSLPEEAHVVWAGPLVTVPQGYPQRDFPSLGVVGAEDAREQITHLIEAGVDLIKITITMGYSYTLSLEEILAITETAHAHGLPVSAHVNSAEDAQRALEGGVDDLAHTPHSRMSDLLIDQLVATNTAIVSTLAVIGSPPEAVDNLRRFAQAGGLIALGNDAGYLRGVMVGMPMNEIRALQEAGFSAMEILQMSTLNAAKVCHLSETIGSLEVGKQADILVINGDPLADLETLDETQLVIHQGTIIVDQR